MYINPLNSKLKSILTVKKPISLHSDTYASVEMINLDIYFKDMSVENANNTIDKIIYHFESLKIIPIVFDIISKKMSKDVASIVCQYLPIWQLAGV